MRWFSSKTNKLIMLLPTVLLYIAYIIIPIAVAAYFSLTRFTGIGSPQFAGMSNYIRLFHDPIFFIALKNTFIVVFVTLLILIPGAFLLALLLNKKLRGMGAIRAINYSPSIIAPIMVGLIWVFILDPKIGLINTFLNKIGLQSLAIQWIGGETLTPYSVAVVQSWQSLGYIATIFLAGLTLIPKEMYEAAEIDGATKFQQLKRITIPFLSETFKLNVILVITLCFKIFETVLQLTNGGPNHLSDVLVTYMYSTTFTAGEYGYGMAIAVASLIATILLAGLILGLFTFGRSLANKGGVRKT